MSESQTQSVSKSPPTHSPEAMKNDITIVSTHDESHPSLGRIYRLTATQLLPRPPEDIFPFFADAHNLQELTPDFLEFQVLTPRPIEMRAGAEIRYKLKVRALPIRWKTTILDWDPPRKFIDNQDAGPYALWHHTHSFQPTPDGRGTICRDIVLYKPKGWIFAALINRFFVERDVVHIFKYRFRRLEALFPPDRR